MQNRIQGFCLINHSKNKNNHEKKNAIVPGLVTPCPDCGRLCS